MTAIDLASKETYQLVRLIHGGATLYYTDWTSNVAHEGNTYLSFPEVEIELPENDGSLEFKEAQVTLPLSSDPNHFSRRVSGTAPHAPVSVIIEEVSKSLSAGPQTTVARTFHGDVQVVKRRRNGNQIVLTAVTIKQRLEIVVGVPCMHQCTNNLGDGLCKVNMAVGFNSFLGVISAIDGREVTISNPQAGKPDRYFRRGYLSFQGLNILVQEWRSASPAVFHLIKRPPSYWVGQTVVCFAGCDKAPTTCDGTFDNLENFMGLGIKMLPYNPQYEDAP